MTAVIGTLFNSLKMRKLSRNEWDCDVVKTNNTNDINKAYNKTTAFNIKVKSADNQTFQPFVVSEID
jgi:hypothetical protein